MSYFVYLILSKTKEKLISYVGYTNNLQKRLELHNKGEGAKFTKGRKWKLIYSKRYNTKRTAMIEEYKLKKNYLIRKNIKLKYKNIFKNKI